VFVIPNPWDIGTARILAAMGFKALATTSAGAGFGDTEFYPTLVEKAAVLCWHLTKNHPLLTGTSGPRSRRWSRSCAVTVGVGRSQTKTTRLALTPTKPDTRLNKLRSA
jgi:hypothetical protein